MYVCVCVCECLLETDLGRVRATEKQHTLSDMASRRKTERRRGEGASKRYEAVCVFAFTYILANVSPPALHITCVGGRSDERERNRMERDGGCC